MIGRLLAVLADLTGIVRAVPATAWEKAPVPLALILGATIVAVVYLLVAYG